MKPTIFLSLIIFVTLSYANEEIVSDKCVSEIMENIIAADRCMDEQVGTPIDIFNRLKWIVFNYDNDSDDSFVNLIEFANRNCAHIPNIMQCLQITLRNTAECPRTKSQQNTDNIKKLLFSAVERITNYICADNSDVIRKLIPNDGLRFLLVNDDFDKCFESVVGRIIDHTEQICPLVDMAAPCVLKVIGDHPNENVLIVTQEIINKISVVAECY